MNTLSERNEHMRSPSNSPLKKLSSDITKLVDDIPDPERKKKKKKKKSKKREESSSEKMAKASEDEWLSDEDKIVIPSSTPKITRASTEKQVAETKEFNVDEVIEKLMSVQHKMPGTLVDLELSTIHQIIERAQKIISEQPMLLEISAPLTVGTDIHG